MEVEENPRILAGKDDTDIENIALEMFMNNLDVSKLYEEYEFNLSKVTGLLMDLMKFGEFQATPVAHFIANLAGFQQIVSTGKFMPVYQGMFVNFDEFSDVFLEYIAGGGVKRLEGIFDGLGGKDFERTEVRGPMTDWRNLR